MSTASGLHADSAGLAATHAAHDTTTSSHQAYRILHFGFTVAPILAGVDKFFNVLTDWSKYLPDVVNNLMGGHGHALMMGVGVVEVVAGIGVDPQASPLQLRCRRLALGHHHQPPPHSRLFRRGTSRLRPVARRSGPRPAERRSRETIGSRRKAGTSLHYLPPPPGRAG